jgi:hypothetical protein
MLSKAKQEQQEAKESKNEEIVLKKVADEPIWQPQKKSDIMLKEAQEKQARVE